MRYILFSIISLFIFSNTYSQDTYTFDQASIYERTDLANKTKSKHIQFHNKKTVNHQGTLYYLNNKKLLLELITGNGLFYDSLVDSYHYEDNFTYIISKDNINRTLTILPPYNKINPKHYSVKAKKENNLLLITIEPIDKKKAKRKNYYSIYYEIDTSVNSIINFNAAMYINPLIKEYKEIKGIITKKCYKNADGIFTNCMKLIETRDIKTSIIAK